jgi:hypothetical protein
MILTSFEEYRLLCTGVGCYSWADGGVSDTACLIVRGATASNWIPKLADVAGKKSFKSQKRREDHISTVRRNRQITPSSALLQQMSAFAIISAAI